jgi:hypothetical protein
MAFGVRDDSAWKNVEALYVMDTTWKATLATWVRRGGQWVPVYLATGGSTAPTASPSDVERYTYAGSKIGIQWVNGDATSATRVYRRASAGGAWALVTSAVAGATTADTGFSSGLFGVAHEKNGFETAIVAESA